MRKLRQMPVQVLPSGELRQVITYGGAEPLLIQLSARMAQRAQRIVSPIRGELPMITVSGRLDGNQLRWPRYGAVTVG